MASTTGSFTFIGALLAVWALRKLVGSIVSRNKRAPYPPGPKPKPIIGNLLDFPMEYSARVYAKWGEEYNSPIVHAESLGNHVTVLNKREDAEELLEQRAKVYSDRVTMPIFNLLGWEYNVALMPYGDEWRQHRRVCQQNFNPHAAQRYETIQLDKIRRFLKGLLETPEDYANHSKQFSIGVPMAMMYGYDIKSVHDPVIEVAEEGNILAATLIVPGGSLINAVKVKQLTEEMMRIPTDFVQKSIADGTATSSLVTDFYEKKYAVGSTKEEEDIVQNIAYTVYGGGYITISSTGTFFYNMLMNPGVQKKAQAELDRVLGSKRLPTLEDRKSLPYIEAIYREVLRIRPPLPICLPHRSTEDDIYKGYFIPKGSAVIPNVWAMTHDESVYEEPFKFKPERFFNADGSLNNDDRILAYGFGRRVCVGKHVASNSMWLLIASILACFSIEPARDKDGKEIEINHEYSESGFMSRKLEFQCSFVVRSPDIEKVILDPNE
uniref:Cytochrome P450 n=1 Tax=Psilocybe cubensis TaxID=181762 RepID=A0A8H7XY19_PSICU